jgi:uncharacterized protein (DUF433 family)
MPRNPELWGFCGDHDAGARPGCSAASPIGGPLYRGQVQPLARKGSALRWAARGRQAYAESVAYERITIDPNRMSGLPCIRDTRVTVSAVLGQLAAGLTIPELLADFPYLDRADVLAALEFAAAAVQERELPLARPA